MVFVVYVLLTMAFAGGGISGQGPPEAAGAHKGSAGDGLLSAAELERKTGAYLFYHQSYIDSENKKVIYDGSIYGAIQNAELKGCRLKLDVLIVDLFSGTAGKTRVENAEDTQFYTIDLPLTREIADGLTLVAARPIQLKRNTNSVCRENRSCALAWLQIKARKAVIKETRTTNHFVDFDGYVESLLIPISGEDAGKKFIGQMKRYTQGNCDDR